MERLLDLLYSIWFCLRVFPFFQALKIPVNISHQVKLGEVWKGCIELKGTMHHNQVYIGHQGYSAIAEQNGLFHISKGGKLIIVGSARFGQGIRLWIDSGATMTVGKNFYCNKNCLFRAFDDIKIGDDVLMGWDIEFNTTDGHIISVNGVEKNNHGEIRIGNHVWIASHVSVSKGAEVNDDSVVASHSLLTRSFTENHILIGGCPASVLKENVDWEQ